MQILAKFRSDIRPKLVNDFASKYDMDYILLQKDDHLEIEEIWVPKVYRKTKGVGSKFVKLVEQVARNKGFNKVQVNNVIGEAEGFYRKLGYMPDPKGNRNWYKYL